MSGAESNKKHEPFYLRYYSGHRGRFGKEFIEFDISVEPGHEWGTMRYVNSSNYRRDELIRKKVTISKTVVKQIKIMIKECEVMKEKDSQWPPPGSSGGIEELEIRMGPEKIVFETKQIQTLSDIQKSSDPEGLRVFYYFVTDVKALVYSMMGLHYKIRPF
ncbi:hypothetical protein DASC09_057580 [Saccharomycopsis crataegensis]|uniref:Mago nashi protein n=1 Tax=Saccharomycopsis crataegensis TaxID=43959 RepID=A0AAV5QUF7_9ASCO|nr:hypothetical protein DASC09_057580 [Saccharomycopsis crataegensis]